jgi:hypothetical protein
MVPIVSGAFFGTFFSILFTFVSKVMYCNKMLNGNPEERDRRKAVKAKNKNK